MRTYILILSLLLIAYIVKGQAIIEGISYDESKVPNYVLPDVLTCNDGSKVTTVVEWEKKRRPEVLEYFYSQEYGRTPKETIAVTYEKLTENPNDMGGRATSKQVRFKFTNGKNVIEAILLVYIPNKRKGKVPIFVGYNFKGNHSTTLDTTVLYSPSFSLVKAPDHPDWQRGNQMNRWCYDKIIDRGYAVATMCYHDIFPDKLGLIKHSVSSLFPTYDPNSTALDEWKAIGVWAWGSSRIVDYLETQDWVDLEKIAIMGHSRQGKAALWAGAQDTRFKVVISNDSGCGGAALSKRVYGENIARIVKIFPHWFCPAFEQYADNEDKLPFDQHELLALIAPRHVYVASAVGDLWADPKGEFLSVYHAGPVYELYGLSGLGTNIMPDIHQPIMTDVGYHIRAGEHDVTDYDWERFMDFCDMHFKIVKRK